MYRFVLSLALIVLSACTTTITEVIEVYPTELSVTSFVSEIAEGSTMGMGANASILGKKTLDAKDIISVTVRDETVLKVMSDFRGQQYCSPGGFTSGVCLYRWVEFRALRSGDTYVVFRAHSAVDSVKVAVHPSGKG